MTLEKDRDCPMLVLMEVRAVDFTYRTFFIRGSRKKSYHKTGTEKTVRFGEV